MSAITEFSINQDRAFFDIVNPQYISWEFYKQYLDKEPPFGAIGDIVDCRTYRRFIPELNRRERAVEAFLRVTDYNMSLVAHLQAKAELVVEAELMFDALFNLKALPSNRSRWVGGTESVRKNPGGIFNCSFTAINRLEAFTDIFNLLCLGVGAGFRVFNRDIKQLPKIVNKGLKIEFEEYKPVSKDQRQENTDVSYAGNSQGAINVDVGDSREGWSTAIKTLLIALTLSETVDNAAHTIIYNFDSVRPFGERILGFGGKASGYQALQGILQEIHKIITECPDDYLRSIDCMDICCATARGVIAGSSRRCLPKGTLVSTSQGLKAIETVNTEDFVYASDGELYSVKNSFVQGTQNICRINTNGNPFYATANHRMAVLTDAKGSYDWKTVAELQPGDRLLQNSFVVDGTPQKLPLKTNQVRPDHSTTCKDFEVPELSSELAWFIGYFFGNGYVNARESGCQLSVTMNADNYELAEKVAAGFALFGDGSAKIFKRPSEHTLEVSINNTRLGEYFSEHIKQAKQPLKTPTWILKAEPVIRAAFLAGLIDSDGCICTRPICLITTVYENFVKEVAAIYASLGIATRLRVQERPEESWQTIYHLHLIGFRTEYNTLIATHSWKGLLPTQLKGQCGFKVPKDFVKSALKRQQYFTRWDGQKDMNFESYQDVSGGLLPFVPITVESVDFNVTNVETYDIEVETKHEFFANGILTHNSALITLFDEDDDLCRNAKTDWKLLEDTGKAYRSQSNNTCCVGSIHYDAFIELLATDPTEEQVQEFLERVKPGKEFFDKSFQVMRTLGEPAIDNFLLMVYKRYLAARKHRPNEDFRLYVDVSTNPCFTGDTLILTKQGHFAIKELVGKTVEVWDGDGWVEVDNFRITSYDEAVYTITLHSGQTITATPYHEFIVEGRGRVQLKDLKNGDKLVTHDQQIHGTHHERGAYLKGFMFGDGTSAQDKPKLNLYSPKYCCSERLLLSGSELEPVRYSTFDLFNLGFGDETPNKSKPMQGITSRRADLLPWVTYQRDWLDSSILNWDLESKLEFIAGLLDADGYANQTANGFTCQLTSVYKQPLEMVQLLLSSIGVESTFRKKNDASRADGYQDFGSERGGRCKVKPAYRLNISQFNSIKLFRQIRTERLQAPTLEQKIHSKSKASTIVDIQFSHVADEVYCCTVHTNNQVSLSNGIVTGNCHEILGTVGIDGYSGSFCNLCCNDLVKLVKAVYTKDTLGNPVVSSYYFDYVECEQLVRLMTRTGIRQTEVNVPMKGWNETQRKERLLGVDAVNGFQDAIALLGWEFDDENSSDLRKKIREWANDEADKYSAKLGIERPLLVTCVKPNGNTGAVLGVSSGIHWGWDTHYMRRVTCNAQDSLSKTLLDQGFTAYPANNDSQLGTKLQKMYFTSLDKKAKAELLKNVDLSKLLELEDYSDMKRFDMLDLISLRAVQAPTQDLLDYYITLSKETQLDILNSCNSIVFEFPIKTTANKSCNEITAIDQLRNQFLFSTEYTDHLPSVTITVKSHEWEDVVNWVFAHWNEGFITASFFSFSEESYPLLANQSISEEDYGKTLLALIENARGVKRLDTDQGTRYAFMLDEELLNKYESGVGFKEEEDLKVDNCTTGCPIK